MKKLAAWYREQPAARMVLRAAAAAAAAYAASAVRGETAFSWKSLAVAAGTAAGYAVLGVLTPVEPFVGKRARVVVPSPPALPARRRPRG